MDYRKYRRIELRTDDLGRGTGFYVQWTHRYRDESSYEIRPIGGSSTREVVLLDSGKFKYHTTPDEREAVREYERLEREEFKAWAKHRNICIDEFKPHAILAGVVAA